MGLTERTPEAEKKHAEFITECRKDLDLINVLMPIFRDQILKEITDVCPECKGAKGFTWSQLKYGVNWTDCPTCHGTGIPDLLEQIAQWLFEKRNSLPDQLFAHGWTDEIKASPYTHGVYLNLAKEIDAKYQAQSILKEQEIRDEVFEQIERAGEIKKMQVGVSMGEIAYNTYFCIHLFELESLKQSR